MFRARERPSLLSFNIEKGGLCYAKSRLPEPPGAVLRLVLLRQNRYSISMENDKRFFEIMARVDEWADANAGWNCRDEAVAEVNFLLNDPIGNMSDDEIVVCACNAWLEAE